MQYLEITKSERYVQWKGDNIDDFFGAKGLFTYDNFPHKIGKYGELLVCFSAIFHPHDDERNFHSSQSCLSIPLGYWCATYPFRDERKLISDIDFKSRFIPVTDGLQQAVSEAYNTFEA